MLVLQSEQSIGEDQITRAYLNIMDRNAAEKNYNSYDKFLYSNDLKGYDN